MSNSKVENVVRELIGLYRDYGEDNYIGEKVTQIQHALQAARQAREEGHSREVGWHALTPLPH